MNIFEEPAYTEDDFVEKQKKFAKYGIEYENPGNLFVPMLTYGATGTVYVGLWFFEKDCARFPKLREAINDVNNYIMEAAGDKLFVSFKTYVKYKKAERYISKLEKKEHVKCFTIEEKDDYKHKYEVAKQRQLEAAETEEKVHGLNLGE